MDDISFGEILRQTRERKGLDLNATARRLRIRPDILRAIEDGNFRAMPPRGYTRNMVNGYARYLGLNPTEITGMYIDELHEFEHGARQARRRPTGIDMSQAPDNTRFHHRQNEGSASWEGDRRARAPRDRNERPRSGRSGHEGRERQRSADRRGARSGSSYTDGLPSMESSRSYHHGSRRYYPESKTHHSLGSVLPRSAFTNHYAGPHREEHSFRSRMPFLIAAIVLLAIIIVVGLAFGANGQRNAESEQVATMPVTGLNSSDNASTDATDTSEDSQEDVEEAPTEATFTYEVADGESTWIEVYVDGQSQIAEQQTGPQSGTYTFSDTLQFVASDIDAVTVTIDGEEQTLEENSKGIVNTTFDFSDILAQWQEEHGQASNASNEGSSSNASNNSSNSSASSSSSSSNNSTNSTNNTRSSNNSSSSNSSGNSSGSN